MTTHISFVFDPVFNDLGPVVLQKLTNETLLAGEIEFGKFDDNEQEPARRPARRYFDLTFFNRDAYSQRFFQSGKYGR